MDLDLMGIYYITNTKNNKMYVGKSINLSQRKLEHYTKLKDNKHPNVFLQNDYNKYGNDYFKFEILEFVDDENKLDYLEDYYIKKLDTLDNGYNQCRGNIKSILKNNNFNKKPETFYYTGEDCCYTLQDLIRMHNIAFNDEILLKHFLEFYIDNEKEPVFFANTKNDSKIYFVEQDLNNYINKCDIFTKNLLISKEAYKNEEQAIKQVKKILSEEWEDFIIERTDKYLNNIKLTSEEIKKGLDIIEKMKPLVKMIGIKNNIGLNYDIEIKYILDFCYKYLDSE